MTKKWQKAAREMAAKLEANEGMAYAACNSKSSRVAKRRRNVS